MIIVITGPTCTGKSKIAVEVAKRLNGEIVNADAFQIYKELNIGTAKPSKEEMSEIPHHLFDFVNANDKYSIYNYQKDARRVIDDILSRKKNVVMVGGSGLYIRAALLDYKFSDEKIDLDLSDYERLNNEELHDELKKIDPDEAEKIHPNNRKRVMRAITIFLMFNKPKSEIIAEQEHKFVYDDVHIYSIDMDKKEIYLNIESRVISMVENGLIKEANDLYLKYGGDIQAMNAIGYKEVIDNLNMGTEDLIKLIQKNTRKYAKRQLTFIRNQYKNYIKPVRNAFDILQDISGSHISYRTISLIGEDNYNKLRKSRVIVFGIGGVGGTAVEALARSGVGTIYIVDDDIVKSSNLNRQILFTSIDLNKEKVYVAEERIKAINSEINVIPYNRFVDEDTISSFPFEKIDYAIDAIDTTHSKILLIEKLLNKNIKFISSVGMGNRLDPSKILITTLDKTEHDPLAKKLRSELRKDNIDLSKINVVTSTEEPIRGKEIITSMIFTPSTAGLLCANYIIQDIIKGGM